MEAAQIYFNEDDFDSDVMLSDDDAPAPGKVEYPVLPERRETKPAAAGPAAPSAFQHLEVPAAKGIPPSSPAVDIPWSSSPVRPPPTPVEEHPRKKTKRTLPQGWNTPQPSLAELRRTTERTKPVDDLGFTQLAADKMGEVKKATRERNAKRKEPIVVPASAADTALTAKSHTLRPARVFLSDEQKHVLHLVTHSKRSVFFTGAAGKCGVRFPGGLRGC